MPAANTTHCIGVLHLDQLCALIFHNILKQTGLRLGTGISLFEWRYARVYVVIVGAAGGLFAFQSLTEAPVWASVAMAILASLLVIRVNRKSLTLGDTFPEVMKMPGMRWLFQTLEGQELAPMEPTARLNMEPCEAGPPLKLWRFMAP